LVVLVAGTATVPAAAATRPQHGAPGHARGTYFAVACGFSHRNQDDPIVFPGLRGRSHDHTYFGNTTTNAFATPASLRAAGTTTCRLRADTAAYWAPTLLLRGEPVEPRGAAVYYVRRTAEPVQAFPAGLKMIAGNAAARAAQGRSVTSWRCSRTFTASATIPTCAAGSLLLQVNFPNCWDGSRLDSADHKAHMAYSTAGVCPASHPVEVPALTIVIHYGIGGGSGLELSSGGQFSGHADFVNGWNQARLTALVDRYLNRIRRHR
jgi:hypothetical protein